MSHPSPKSSPLQAPAPIQDAKQAAQQLAWLMAEGLYEPLSGTPADWANFHAFEQTWTPLRAANPAPAAPRIQAAGQAASQAAPGTAAERQANAAPQAAPQAASPRPRPTSGQAAPAIPSAPPVARPKGQFATASTFAAPMIGGQEPQADPAALSAARQAAQAATSLSELEHAVRNFEGCALKRLAKNTVFADGTAGSPVMLLGEAPGADEDRSGKPFVGVSGQLLDRMLSHIGLDRRQNFYISNILFWRPPGNRTPSSEEIALCDPFVRRHIALAKPKILVFLGGSPAKALTGSPDGILKQRGKWLDYHDPTHDLTLPALPMLHPAYLLRQPRAKREAWSDCLSLSAALAEAGLAPNQASAA